MEDSTLALLIGLMAGSIFFIDGWGPSEKNDDFLKSKRFRGLSILIAGGIITPILDYVTKNQRPKFFLSYLEGSVIGWFFVFMLALLIYLFWKSTIQKNNNSKVHKAGDFAYSILDFIYLGIADNPHLKAKRDSDVLLSKKIYKQDADNFLKERENELKRKLEDPNKKIDKKIKQELQEYENQHMQIRTESDYGFNDWYLKGLLEFNRDEYEKTIAYMKNALEKDKADKNAPDAHIYMGIAYFRLSLFEKSLEQNNVVINNYPDYQHLYIAFINKGISLEMLLPDKKDALSAYDEAIKLKPDYELAWITKADLLLKQEKTDQANEAINEASKFIPENGGEWAKRGDIFRRLKRYQEAINDYDKAIELKVEKLEGIWLNKGICHAVIGNFTEALKCYKKSLELRPRYAAAFYNIACTNALMGDKKLMLENLVVAINLDAKYKNLSKIENDFREFWDDPDFKKVIQ